MPVEAFKLDGNFRDAMISVELDENHLEDYEAEKSIRANFKKLRQDKENFILNTGLLRKELQAEEAALKSAAEFISEKRGRLSNKINALADMLVEEMLTIEPEKKGMGPQIKKGGYTCFLRTSRSLRAKDPELLNGIPDEYVKVTLSLKTQELKKDYKEGKVEELPPGVLEVISQSFVMR